MMTAVLWQDQELIERFKVKDLNAGTASDVESAESEHTDSDDGS